jgi:hypothetical protein
MYRRAVTVAVVALAMALWSPAALGAADTRSRWPVGVTSVTKSPLGPRRQSAIAVRGSRVFVVGGEKIHPGGSPYRRMNDGAAFDLRTKTWTRLPKAPFKRTSVSSAQWVGRDLVVTGVTCPGGVGDEHGCTGGRTVAAVYSPRTGSWRSLKVPARFQVRFGARLEPLMATRDEAWFVQSGMNTIAMNPRTGKWRSIPPTLLGSVGSTCAAKRYAATLGGVEPMVPGGLRLLSVDDDEWGSLLDPHGFPDAPIDGSPTCNADSVVVVVGDLRGWTCVPGVCPSSPMTGSLLARVLRYDLTTGRWSQMPKAPPTQESGAIVGHGGFVDFLGPGLRLTTASGAWTPIARGPKFEVSPYELVAVRGLIVGYVGDELVVYRAE